MIYSELKNYLAQVSDADVIDLFDRASEVLTKIQFEDWLDVMENAIGDTSDQGDSAVVDVMRLRLVEMLDSALQMHGVVVVDEALISERVNLLEALVAVGNAPDKDSLRAELQSGDSNEEIFASMVALLSTQPIEKTLAILAEVSEGLIGRLKEMLDSQALLHMSEEDADIAPRLVEYQKFKIVFANDIRWTDRFIEFKQSVGLPFESYVKLYKAHQLSVDLEFDRELAWRRICVNLIGIGCVSEGGSVRTAEAAKPLLEKICPEMGELTRLYSKLTNLLVEFNRAQT